MALQKRAGKSLESSLQSFLPLVAGAKSWLSSSQRTCNLIEKFGRKGTELKGVFFTEGQIATAKVVGAGSVTSDRQNISIEILKERLAEQAIAQGANAVDNYKYVQKGSVWSFSSTRWVMTGRLLQAEE